MLDWGTATTVLCAGVGGVAWVVKLQGRVDGHDTLFAEREKNAIERHGVVTKDLDTIKTLLWEMRDGPDSDQTGRHSRG